jgi:hypothetical protein
MVLKIIFDFLELHCCLLLPSFVLVDGAPLAASLGCLLGPQFIPSITYSSHHSISFHTCCQIAPSFTLHAPIPTLSTSGSVIMLCTLGIMAYLCDTCCYLMHKKPLAESKHQSIQGYMACLGLGWVRGTNTKGRQSPQSRAGGAKPRQHGNTNIKPCMWVGGHYLPTSSACSYNP